MIKYDLDIEKNIVGTIITQEDIRMSEFLAMVEPEFFFNLDMRKIIKFLYKEPTNDLLILHKKTGVKGGLLSEVVDMALKTPNDFVKRVNLLKDLYIKREFQQLAKQDAKSPEDIIMHVEKFLHTISQHTHQKRGVIQEAIDEYRIKNKDKDAMFSGLKTWDMKTEGLKKGQIWTIGADTGYGKSYFAINFALKQALEGRHVLFFSTELPVSENARRFALMLQKYEKIPSLDQAITELEMFDNLYIYDDRESIESIKTEIHLRNKITPVDLVVIDHIQDLDNGLSSEYDELRRTCGIAKNMAITENVGVILLSQIKGEGERVQVFHGAKKIKQISTIAAVMYRDILEDGKVKKLGNQGFFEIIKNRFNGKTGICEFNLSFPEGIFYEPEIIQTKILY